jgi:hypothetical protein
MAGVTACWVINQSDATDNNEFFHFPVPKLQQRFSPVPAIRENHKLSISPNFHFGIWNLKDGLLFDFTNLRVCSKSQK